MPATGLTFESPIRLLSCEGLRRLLEAVSFQGELKSSSSLARASEKLSERLEVGAALTRQELKNVQLRVQASCARHVVQQLCLRAMELRTNADEMEFVI